jgi:catechol-2,3-dioxygenase
MGEPLIVVSTLRKQGRLEDVMRYYKKILELIEANEPQLIAFQAGGRERRLELRSFGTLDRPLARRRGSVVTEDNLGLDVRGSPGKSAVRMALS